MSDRRRLSASRMMHRLPALLLSVLLLSAAMWLAASGCSSKSQDQSAAPEVVVYTCLDQSFSEPILTEFERRTGIKVSPRYDAESAKTTGLVNLLITRRDNPDCDVFWNNEIMQTHRLATMGILVPYASPNAARIPAQYRDSQSRWTGFAGRARVLIYNTQHVSPADVPTTIANLADAKWRGKAALARPFFGTTFTHASALYAAWGPARMGKFLDGVAANDVALCPGNASVRDMVAAGERAWGLTDTDDALEAVRAGKPVKAVMIDADLGLMLIPNTVALVDKCPHGQAARKLIDYLLSADVERMLAQCPSAQIPLGTDLADLPTPWDDLLKARRLSYDVAAMAANVEPLVNLLQEEKMDR